MKRRQLSRKSIQDVAEQISTTVKYEGGEDLRSTVERMGGKIKVVDVWNEVDQGTGSLTVWEPGQFEITIPAHTNYLRDNFTIAHELGHYVVHYLLSEEEAGKLYQANRYGSGRSEWEANWFAAAFLMPEEKYRTVFSEYCGDLARIAQRFGVSVSAARVRAQALGLLNGKD